MTETTKKDNSDTDTKRKDKSGQKSATERKERTIERTKLDDTNKGNDNREEGK